MRILSLLVVFSFLASCDLTTGDDCGPWPARTAFERRDTVAMSWLHSSLKIFVSGQGTINPTVTAWGHADSIRLLAIHRGTSQFDTLEFDHRVIQDTVIELYLRNRQLPGKQGGVSIECTPAYDPQFITEVSLFVPASLIIRD